jgi:probable selenate reductase FAD-binding subunit
MTPFQYHRPKTLAEALELLDRAVPLAGGTALTPRRDEIPAVIDLQDLGMRSLELSEGTVFLGACVKLQTMVESEEILPSALREASRLEASLNLRNMATLGGTIMSADGRSPLVTVLLAMEAVVVLEPGDEVVSLETLLDQRDRSNDRRLITEIRLRQPETLCYEQVSRAPTDRPLVCAAVARLSSEGSGNEYRIVLGGFGTKPIRIQKAETSLAEEEDIDTVAEVARQAYASASDMWASGEYRSHIAGVLVKRLATETVS